MKAAVTPTRTGLFAWIARRVELIRVTATIAWGEQDRDMLERTLAAAPIELAQLNLDLQALRVRKATLTD